MSDREKEAEQLAALLGIGINEAKRRVENPETIPKPAKPLPTRKKKASGK